MSHTSEETKRELYLLLRRFKKEKFHPHIYLTDVTPAEINVIITIFFAKKESDDPVQPRMIAAHLHQSPSALSQILKAVEEKGFIERHRSREDSRAITLELTEKGIDLASQFSQKQDAFLDELIERLGEKDVEDMIRILRKAFDFMSEKADAGDLQRGFHGCQSPPPFEPTVEVDLDCISGKGTVCE